MGRADSLRGKKLVVWNYLIDQFDTRSFGYPKYFLNDDGTMQYVDIDTLKALSNSNMLGVRMLMM